MSLYDERRNRKPTRRCERCTERIAVGASYVRAALPPWAEPNESDHWWTLDLHGRHWEDCPRNAAELARLGAAS